MGPRANWGFLRESPYKLLSLTGMAPSIPTCSGLGRGARAHNLSSRPPRAAIAAPSSARRREAAGRILLDVKSAAAGPKTVVQSVLRDRGRPHGRHHQCQCAWQKDQRPGRDPLLNDGLSLPPMNHSDGIHLRDCWPARRGGEIPIDRACS